MCYAQRKIAKTIHLLCVPSTLRSKSHVPASSPEPLEKLSSVCAPPKSPLDIAPTPGQEHVQSVIRAMSLLKAFDGGDAVFLTLTELARRTGMHKPTALRLARSLALSRFMVQR